MTPSSRASRTPNHHHRRRPRRAAGLEGAARREARPLHAPGSRLQVTARLAAEQEFELRVKYAGTPGTLKAPDLDDAGWEELTDGVIVAAQPHGAPTWFPCNDRPSNKATYAITMAAPNEYYVAMCGRLTDKRRRGSVTEWTWEMAEPMAPYLATVQIGRYEARELANGVIVIAPPDLSGEEYDASFGQQPAMMEFFESVFGDLPVRRLHRRGDRRPARDPAGVPVALHLRSQLRLQRVESRPAGRPRAGPPVVRQRGDPAGVEGHLAARGVRLLRRVAVVGGVRARHRRRAAPSTTTTSSPVSTRTCCSPTPARR